MSKVLSCANFIIKESIENDAYIFTETLIRAISHDMSIDIDEYHMDQVIKGMKVEMEHGAMYGNDTNVTGNDPVMTLQITLAHLKEDPYYYDKLEIVEDNKDK